MNFLKLLLTRPEDKTIRILKVIFWAALWLISIAVYYQNIGFDEKIFGITTTQNIHIWLWVCIWILSIFPIISGVTDLSLLSRGHTRILQIVYGVLILIFGILLKENPKIGFEIFYPLLGIIAIFAGISGKILTKKWLKAKQKITKIRV